MERQAQGPDEWEEMHEMSMPSFATRNQDHLGTDNSEDSGPEGYHAEENQRTLPRPPPLPQAHWGNSSNWSRR